MSRYSRTLLTGIILTSLIGAAAADHLFQGSLLLQSDSSFENLEEASVHIQKLLTQNNIAFHSTEEAHMLDQLLPQEEIHKFTLLQEHDRIGSISFVRTEDAFDLFLALKQTLSLSFSPDVRNLKDEQKTSNKGQSLLLQFYDPALNSESMILGASVDFLYEFHSVEEHTETMQDLIKNLLGIQD